MSTSPSNSPSRTEQAQALLTTTMFAGWRIIMAAFHPETHEFLAAILERPKDSEALNPFAFYLPGGKDEAVVIRNSSLFLLAIEVAHRWANTDELVGINDSLIADILANVAFNHMGNDERVETLSTLLRILTAGGDALADDKVE